MHNLIFWLLFIYPDLDIMTFYVNKMHYATIQCNPYNQRIRKCIEREKIYFKRYMQVNHIVELTVNDLLVKQPRNFNLW